jgi:hypothetical protein
MLYTEQGLEREIKTLELVYLYYILPTTIIQIPPYGAIKIEP